jgi:hypothetical protein
MTKTLSHILGLALTVFFCVVAAFPAAAQSTYGSEPLASFNRIGTYSVTVKDAPTSATTAVPGTLYRTTSLANLQAGNSFTLSLNEPRTLAYRTVEGSGSTLKVRLRVFGNSPWGAQTKRSSVTSLTPSVNPSLLPPDIVCEDVTLNSSELEYGQEVFAPGPLLVYIVTLDNGAANDTLVINKYGIGSPFINARPSDFVSMTIGTAAFSPADPDFATDWTNIFNTRTGAILPNAFASGITANTTVTFWTSTSYQSSERGIKAQRGRLYTLIED